jgi:iron complex transport system ATP-binding protein
MADTIWLMTSGEQMAIGSPKTLAEQGALGRFIERDGIAFDPETMAIKVTKMI